VPKPSASEVELAIVKVNPWITEQKNFLLLWNWVHFVPIFFKLFSQHFFYQGFIYRLN